MKSSEKRIVLVTSLFWVACIVAAFGLKKLPEFRLVGGECVNEEINIQPNPEGDIYAIYYKRHCDALTSYDPVVALRRGADGKYVNIFAPKIISPLKMEWEDNQTLRISSPGDSNTLRVAKTGGIKIKYFDHYFPHKEF